MCTCLLERATRRLLRHFIDVDGVVGVWSCRVSTSDASLASALAGQTLTYCFLDDDPVDVAQRLRPAPDGTMVDATSNRCSPHRFYPVVPHQWDRHVP